MSEDNDDDNEGDNDDDDNTDWRQVTKGRRAVTQTDERRATPVRNQFQGLSEDQEEPTPRLAPRELIAAFSRLPPEDDNAKTIGSTETQEDDNTDIPEDDNAETGSFGSTESLDTMTDIKNDYGSLIEIIRLVNAEQAIVYNGKKKNYAEIVKFREVLGSALSKQPCSGTHGGYSWLVDTEEDYTYRVGATTPYTAQTMPKGPPLPTEPPKSASTSAYKRYTIDQQKYNQYLHWNTEALTALEHRFPNSLTPKKNKFDALPITYTIREAVDYLESLVNTDVEKRETYCAIVRDITRRTYQPNLEGPNEYFAAMQSDKHSIDVLKQSELTYDALIIHSQDAFRHSGIPMKEMRTIDEAWRKDQVTYNYIGKTKWTAFTNFYTKTIKELQDDGMDHNGTAHLTNQMAALVTRTNKIEARTQTDLLQLEENQSQLAHAYKSIKSNHVPSEVTTEPNTLRSSVTGPASAYFTTNDINTNLTTEVAELRKQLENLTRQNQTHQQTRQGSRPPTTTNRGAPTDQWRTWTFWCHTHGANLTHNSNACSRPKDGHKKEATQRNPMGGNCKRDYLTGQWCHPVYHTPHATPTTAA